MGLQLVTRENANERSSMRREIRYACPAICRGIMRVDIKVLSLVLWLDERMRGWIGISVGRPGMNGYVRTFEKEEERSESSKIGLGLLLV